MNPFGVLVQIARRSQQASKELPAKEDSQALWTGIGVTLLDQRFAIDMEEVSELMRMPSATKIPGVKAFVNGVANVRGRLMPLLDLAHFFGSGPSVARSQRRVVVVEGDEIYFGFVVDGSVGMQHFPAESFVEEQSPEVAEPFRPFIKGTFESAGTVWPVISLLSLAEDERFHDLAA